MVTFFFCCFPPPPPPLWNPRGGGSQVHFQPSPPPRKNVHYIFGGPPLKLGVKGVGIVKEEFTACGVHSPGHPRGISPLRGHHDHWGGVWGGGPRACTIYTRAPKKKITKRDRLHLHFYTPPCIDLQTLEKDRYQTLKEGFKSKGAKNRIKTMSSKNIFYRFVHASPKKCFGQQMLAI